MTIKFEKKVKKEGLFSILFNFPIILLLYYANYYFNIPFPMNYCFFAFITLYLAIIIFMAFSNIFSDGNFIMSVSGDFLIQNSPSKFLSQSFKIHISEIVHINCHNREAHPPQVSIILKNGDSFKLSTNYGSPYQNVVKELLDCNKNIIYKET